MVRTTDGGEPAKRIAAKKIHPDEANSLSLNTTCRASAIVGRSRVRKEPSNDEGEALCNRTGSPSVAQNGLVTPTRGIAVRIQPSTKLVFRAGGIGASGCSATDGSKRMACNAKNMQTAQLETHRE